MKDFVTIITFSYHHEMLVLKGYLEAHDIFCFVPNENTIQMQPLYSDVLGGFEIQVHKRDFKKAAELLRASNYTVENGHYEHEEYVPDNRKPSGSNEITRIVVLLVVVVIGALLAMRVFSVKEQMDSLDLIGSVVANRWCVNKITSDMVEYTPATLGKKFIGVDRFNCPETIRFSNSGNMYLPGFQSDEIICDWHLVDGELLVRTRDTLSAVFNQSYRIELNNDKLILRSRKTQISCTKFRP